MWANGCWQASLVYRDRDLHGVLVSMTETKSKEGYGVDTLWIGKDGTDDLVWRLETKAVARGEGAVHEEDGLVFVLLVERSISRPCVNVHLPFQAFATQRS